MDDERGMVVAAHSVAVIKEQVNQIQELMASVMTINEHYGVIPGTTKNTLYKSGAEKLSMMFRLAPEYKTDIEDLGNWHKNITVSCTLVHIPTDARMGQGVGSCSTMESKYRWRNVAGYEVLDIPIPNDSKENKAVYRKQGFGMQKDDALGWVWVKYGSSERQENPDIADVYNTVLKMAKKRAHTDAILTVLAASDIFTQDHDEDTEPPTTEPAKPDYDSEASIIVNIRACNTVASLKGVCSRFKDDYKAGKTGLENPSWKRIVAVMEEVKNKLDPPAEEKQEEKTEPATEAQIQNQGPVDENPEFSDSENEQPPISDDDMPAFMK